MPAESLSSLQNRKETIARGGEEYRTTQHFILSVTSFRVVVEVSQVVGGAPTRPSNSRFVVYVTNRAVGVAVQSLHLTLRACPSGNSAVWHATSITAARPMHFFHLGMSPGGQGDDNGAPRFLSVLQHIRVTQSR